MIPYMLILKHVKWFFKEALIPSLVKRLCIVWGTLIRERVRTGSLCYELLVAGAVRTVPKLKLILVYYTELSGNFIFLRK